MPLSTLKTKKKKKAKIHLPIKEDIQLSIRGDMSLDCRGWKVSALNLRHMDTQDCRPTGTASTKYPSRRYLCAGCASHTTHDRASLPASKHQGVCIPVFYGRCHIGPNTSITTGAGRHNIWALTVLRVLTPLGFRASSWFILTKQWHIYFMRFACDAFFF